MKLESKHLEFFCILFFLGLLLYTGMATIMDFRLYHEAPYGYSASDAFWDLAQQMFLQDSGNYRYMPYYMRAGFKDTVGFHMPIFGHLVVLFSHASGLPVHDANLIIPFIFSIVSAMIFYIIMRNFNKNIAVISLALAVFLYIRNFTIVYLWGIWDIIVASSFVLASMWALDRLEIKHSSVLLGIFTAAVALTHITEAAYLALFIVIFVVIKLLRKKMKFSDIKKIFVAGILSLILAFYYLPIFRYGYGRTGSDFSFRITKPERYDVIINHFGVSLFLIVIGAVIAVYIVLTKEKYFAPLAGLFLLFAGYTNFIGDFGPRAMQIRYMWPVYLSVFFGISIYFMLKLAIKNWKLYFSVIISIILAIAFVKAYHTATPQQGLMDDEHWKAFTWVWKNTDPDSRILFFYGDPYTQEAVVFTTKRTGYRVDFDDFTNTLKNKTIKRYYTLNVAAADDGELQYRISFFKYGYHFLEANTSDYFGPLDICKFDYYVFDKVSRQPILVQYNFLIANDLLKKEFITKAFENNEVIILKNNKVGADCIEKRSF